MKGEGHDMGHDKKETREKRRTQSTVGREPYSESSTGTYGSNKHEHPFLL